MGLRSYAQYYPVWKRGALDLETQNPKPERETHNSAALPPESLWKFTILRQMKKMTYFLETTYLVISS